MLKFSDLKIALSIIGGFLVLTPGAPIVFAIGVIPVTTAMLGALFTSLGAAFGSYGAAKRADNINNK